MTYHKVILKLAILNFWSLLNKEYPTRLQFYKITKRSNICFQIADLPQLMSDLSLDKVTWDEVSKQYPEFVQQEATKSES